MSLFFFIFSVFFSSPTGLIVSLSFLVSLPLPLLLFWLLWFWWWGYDLSNLWTCVEFWYCGSPPPIITGPWSLFCDSCKWWDRCDWRFIFELEELVLLLLWWWLWCWLLFRLFELRRATSCSASSSMESVSVGETSTDQMSDLESSWSPECWLIWSLDPGDGDMRCDFDDWEWDRGLDWLE